MNLKKFGGVILLGITIVSAGCAVIRMPEEQRMIEAIALSGEWFLNNQDEQFLYYEYDPIKKEWPDSHHAMREMGALWSITQLGNFLDDDRYEMLALRGYDYFSATFEEEIDENGNPYIYVNITPSKIKLGYNAFMILTLLELDIPDKDETLEKLANGIVTHQWEDGELDTFFFSERETGIDYYPGEALLALMTLYEHTGNEEYLETVQNAFPFYVGYWRANPNTAFVPWQTQAYFKLYQVTEDKEVAEFIFEMADYMVFKYSEGNFCEDLDLDLDIGSVIAVYSEGMNKAYELAVQLKDDRAECYAKFIQGGMEEILKLQFPMEDQNPEDFEEAAIGGVFGSDHNLTMRVDRNQHAALALIGAYELGLF